MSLLSRVICAVLASLAICYIIAVVYYDAEGFSDFVKGIFS